MKTLVDTNSISTCASNIESKLKLISKAVDRINQRVDNLSSIWQGEIYVNFSTKMKDFYDVLKDYETYIEGYENYLRDYSKIIKNLDSSYNNRTITLE